MVVWKKRERLCYLFFYWIDRSAEHIIYFVHKKKKTLVGKRSFRLVDECATKSGVDGKLDIHQLRHIRDEAEAKWSERRTRTTFIQKNKRTTCRH